MAFCNLNKMKSLLSVAVLFALLAVNRAASSSSKTPKLRFQDEASSSSESGGKTIHASCLMHFVDKDTHPNLYLANGGLISNNKVLTTRVFLQPYAIDTSNKNLTVFSSTLKTNDPLSKVNQVHIDQAYNSELAVASLESPLTYGKFITNCVLTFKHRRYIPQEQIIVSGWRFQNRHAATKVLHENSRKSMLFMLNRRENNAQGLKQESYHRLSFVGAASGAEYKDRNCEMNVGDEGALVSVIKKTATEEQTLLLAIASVEKQVYITLSSSKNFIRPLYANQEEPDS